MTIGAHDPRLSPGSVQDIGQIEPQNSEHLLLPAIVLDGDHQDIRQRIADQETHPVRENRLDAADDRLRELQADV